MRMFAGDVLPKVKFLAQIKRKGKEIGKQSKKGMTRWGDFFPEKLNSWYFTENKM